LSLSFASAKPAQTTRRLLFMGFLKPRRRWCHAWSGVDRIKLSLIRYSSLDRVEFRDSAEATETYYMILPPGLVDFSGPCCILFGSSAFHEPRRLGVSARTRLFTVPFPLGVTHHQDTNAHIHTYPKDQISISALLNMQSVHRDWVVYRDRRSPKSPRHGQRQSSDATGARRFTEE
jgi:hypothetical protein